MVKKMKQYENLIYLLVDYTYDSGYYSGKGLDGTFEHEEAVWRRDDCKKRLIAEIKLEIELAKKLTSDSG